MMKKNFKNLKFNLIQSFTASKSLNLKPKRSQINISTERAIIIIIIIIIIRVPESLKNVILVHLTY